MILFYLKENCRNPIVDKCGDINNILITSLNTTIHSCFLFKKNQRLNIIASYNLTFAQYN